MSYLQALFERASLTDNAPNENQYLVLPKGCRENIEYNLVVDKSIYEQLIMEARRNDPMGEAVLVGLCKHSSDPQFRMYKSLTLSADLMRIYAKKQTEMLQAKLEDAKSFDAVASEEQQDEIQEESQIEVPAATGLEPEVVSEEAVSDDHLNSGTDESTDPFVVAEGNPFGAFESPAPTPVVTPTQPEISEELIGSFFNGMGLPNNMEPVIAGDIESEDTPIDSEADYGVLTEPAESEDLLGLLGGMPQSTSDESSEATADETEDACGFLDALNQLSETESYAADDTEDDLGSRNEGEEDFVDGGIPATTLNPFEESILPEATSKAIDENDEETMPPFISEVSQSTEETDVSTDEETEDEEVKRLYDQYSSAISEVTEVATSYANGSTLVSAVSSVCQADMNTSNQLADSMLKALQSMSEAQQVTFMRTLVGSIVSNQRDAAFIAATETASKALLSKHDFGAVDSVLSPLVASLYPEDGGSVDG